MKEERYEKALYTVMSTMQGDGMMDSFKPLDARTTNMVIEFVRLVLTTDRDVKEIADTVNKR